MSDNMNAGGSVGGIPAAAVGSFNDPPKASIGNYKGVMLCNRPNEFGQQRRPEPTGPQPFKSRVDPKSANPLGWNPCPRVLPKSQKKRSPFTGVLTRHKMYLKQLETAKVIEREDQMIARELEDARINKFKDQAERQRKKIQQLKTDKEQDAMYEEALGSQPEQIEMDYAPVDIAPEQVERSKASAQKLTSDALSAMDMDAGPSIPSASKQKSVASKSKKSQKPAWAKTEKQIEEEKEAEIDDLLEFAYDLDYDKYMEDFEVKQAFEIIRDRVSEIKQDMDWKEKIADEWNKTVEEEAAQGGRKQVASDQRSVYSYKSNRSNASQTSYKSQVALEKKRVAAEKNEWDRSTVASDRNKQTVEERVAARIASDVLKDNQKLRGVHSKESLKKLFEREAKRQLLLETNGGVYNPPTVARVELRPPMNTGDPSNLPHLHKCPYV